MTVLASVARLASGATAAQAIAIVAAPVTTRLYDPSTYGLQGTFVALVTVVAMVATFRYHAAIVIAENQRTALEVAWLCYILLAVVSLLSCAIVWQFGAAIAKLLGAPGLTPLLWLVPLAIVARAGTFPLQSWFSRLNRFQPIATSQVIESVSGSLLAIGAGFAFGSTAAGLIGTRVIAWLLSLGYMFGQAWRTRGGQRIEGVHFAALAKVAFLYRRLPLLSTWAVLANSAAYVLPWLLISALFSPAVLGLFLLADRIVITPLTMVGSAVGQVFFRASAGAADGLPSLIVAAVRKLVLIAVFPMLLLAILGRDLFAFAFGGAWAEAGVFAQILVVYAIMRFVVAPLGELCTVLHRQDLELRFNIVLLVVRGLAVLAGAARDDMILAVWLLSLSSALAYGLLLLWLCRASATSIRGLLRTLVGPVLQFVALAAVVLAARVTLGAAMAGSIAVLATAAYAIIVVRSDVHFARVWQSVSSRITARLRSG